MEKAARDCLKDRDAAASLERRLSPGGKAEPGGTSAEICAFLGYRCGYGYRLAVRQSQANKPHQAPITIPADAPPGARAEYGEANLRYGRIVAADAEELTAATFIIRVVDSRRRLVVVETGWPTPREWVGG